jgi:phosphosulfolactate phosphohydrolase-like enzyme
MSAPRPSGAGAADAGRTVAIDILPDSIYRYVDFDAVVCIDVILDCTLLVTAAAGGRRALAVRAFEDARGLFTERDRPLFCGEGLGLLPGEPRPAGLTDLLNEPDPGRPLVVACSPGADLITRPANAARLYLACLRNVSATVERLATQHQRVALIGAGAAGEYRCEDQMVAAWIARRLLDQGFVPHSLVTTEAITRWGEADAALAGWGKSAEDLRRRGRQADLDLVLGGVDDLPVVCTARGGVVLLEPEGHGVARRAGSAA